MVSLTRDELVRLLKTASESGHENSARDHLLLLVTFSHGLRESEAVALTTAHFRDGEITVKRLKGSLATTQPLLEHAEPLLDEKAAVERYLKNLTLNHAQPGNTNYANDSNEVLVQRTEPDHRVPQPAGRSKAHVHGRGTRDDGTEFLFPSAKSKSGHLTRFGFIYLMRHYCALAGIPRKKATPHKLKHTCAMLAIKKAGIENVRQHLGHKNISSTGQYLKVDDADASAAMSAAFGGAAHVTHVTQVTQVTNVTKANRSDVARKAWETRKRNQQLKESHGESEIKK